MLHELSTGSSDRSGISDEDAVRREIVRRIVTVADPERIVLFGSRARGQQRPDSDVDILVIEQTSEPRHRRSVPLYRALASLPVEVDIVVYTPEEVAEWSAVRQALVTTAIREGAVIYERSA